MKYVDQFLNSITMYRLVLYYLLVLVGVGAVFSLVHILSFNIIAYLASAGFLVAVAWLTNTIFADTFEAPTNVESVYISALILALVIAPAKSFLDLQFLGLAAGFTLSSKYILALHHKHIFNPVAIGLVLASLATNSSASWWVSSVPMLPFVLVGGLLVIRKLRHFDLVVSFFLTAVTTIFVMSVFKGSNVIQILRNALLESPFFFFAAIMITEPLTTPPNRKLRIYYGALVGFLFAPQIHLGSLYTTPELALVLGNVFSYLVSPKEKLLLTLKQKLQVAPDIYDFIFKADQKLSFTPGQYLEWTLSHDQPDARGNRRYFTVASSPTEEDLRIGVKFYPQASTYKQKMLTMDEKKVIVASQMAGDFVLPADPHTKLVLIAGGIGITPFRSMLKYLIDRNQKRDIVVFVVNKLYQDIVYVDVLNEALTKLGIRTVYILTDKEHVPSDWQGEVGRIDAAMIQRQVPDYLDRKFYLSGPHTMVTAYEEVLHNLGVARLQIKTDFFPGFV